MYSFRLPPGVCYISVVVETPEQLLPEGVQTGRDGEGDHSTSTIRISLRAPLDQLVVLPSLAPGPAGEGDLQEEAQEEDLDHIPLVGRL